MKVPTGYIRAGRIVKLVEGNTDEQPPQFKSINAAKRWTREKQLKNGGLGAGYVQVVR